jgi:hypothetical protein
MDIPLAPLGGATPCLPITRPELVATLIRPRLRRVDRTLELVSTIGGRTSVSSNRAAQAKP